MMERIERIQTVQPKHSQQKSLFFYKVVKNQLFFTLLRRGVEWCIVFLSKSESAWLQNRRIQREKNIEVRSLKDLAVLWNSGDPYCKLRSPLSLSFSLAL